MKSAIPDLQKTNGGGYFVVYDSKKRSLGKTLSWRIIATSMGMGLIYICTKELEFSLMFGLVDVVAKSVAYYLHERMWAR